MISLGPEWGWGLTTGELGFMEMLHSLHHSGVCISVCICPNVYIECVYLNWVHFIVCKLCLNKVDLKDNKKYHAKALPQGN